jgi:hypothetical protein
MIDVALVAAGAVKILAPFLPYLMDVGKDAGKKLEEVIFEKGGDALWKKAQSLWIRITERYKRDDEMTDAAKTVARAPADKTRQEVLMQVLARLLKDSPDFASDLEVLMGGENALQQIVAGDEAQIRRIQQEMDKRTPEKENQTTNTDATELVCFVREHLAERRATFGEHELIAEALNRGMGKVSLSELEAAIQVDPELVRLDQQKKRDCGTHQPDRVIVLPGIREDRWR